MKRFCNEMIILLSQQKNNSVNKMQNIEEIVGRSSTK